MAVSEGAPSDVMAVKLDALLLRAQALKKTTSVQPPLQVSELATDEEPLFAPISGDKDMHMIAFETAARNIFYSKLACQPPAPYNYI